PVPPVRVRGERVEQQRGRPVPAPLVQAEPEPVRLDRPRRTAGHRVRDPITLGAVRPKERLWPALYDLFNRSFGRGTGAAMRRRLLAGARGRVLEIGAGTGANVAHYPDGLAGLVLTDPSEGMLRRARERAAEAGRAATAVRAAADALPFEDGSF